MKLIKPSFIIEDDLDVIEKGVIMLKSIEKAGRTCYKSESKITEESAIKFVKMVLDRGHHSVIEHEKVTVRVICDRGVTHEIVRHRLASYSQESTRYCNYSGGVTFIIPIWLQDKIKEGEYTENDSPVRSVEKIWFDEMIFCEMAYKELLKEGWTSQQARSVLPNSLKTEIVMTMNLREWRHFFTLRTSSKAHPQMQEIARPMLDEFKKLIPVVFDDINYE